MTEQRPLTRAHLTLARGRVTAALVAGAVLTTLLVTAPGSAQDLDRRRDGVEQRIDQTGEQLDQSSSRLTAADRALGEAMVSLATARQTLAETRGELAAAEAFDAQMQSELDAAVQELRRSRRDAARSRVQVEEQESVLRNIAVDQYATGDPALLALSMVLNTQDTAMLTSQLSSVDSVLDKEAVTLDHLEASRVILATKQEALAEARQEVARRRAAAAENLEHKAVLETRAEQAQTEIQQLVTTRSQARAEAAAARAEDLRQLRSLETERDKISELLRLRAEEARRKAEAAAAARERARQQAAEEAAARKAARAEAAALRAAEAREAAQRQARADDAVRRAAEAEAAQRRADRARAAAKAASRSVHRPAPAPAPAPSSSQLGSPVDGYLTSSYGMRFHPVYKRWSLHDGTDFGASCGTPVRAAAGGTVIALYHHSAYGNRVIMDHGYRSGVGLGTSYNHLSAYSSYVGQTVQQGEVIGYVGTTGASTGCHLHFMVFENGATVNPMNWL